MSGLTTLLEKGLMAPDWAEAMAPVDEQIAAMGRFLRAESAAHRHWLPHGDQIFRAFERPLSQVKVLLVGQDPYPTRGNPIGLSFSVAPGKPLPGSLVNIFRELVDDQHVDPPTSGDLTPWADAGVMLLNRCLTVREGAAGSHRGKGWEPITEQAIRVLAARRAAGQPLAAILWGSDARKLKGELTPITWAESVHPSNLSAHKGFFGSKPFSKVNRMLEDQGGTPVDWRLP